MLLNFCCSQQREARRSLPHTSQTSSPRVRHALNTLSVSEPISFEWKGNTVTRTFDTYEFLEPVSMYARNCALRCALSKIVWCKIVCGQPAPHLFALQEFGYSLPARPKSSQHSPSDRGILCQAAKFAVTARCMRKLGSSFFICGEPRTPLWMFITQCQLAC